MQTIFEILILALGFLLYFLPSFMAAKKEHFGAILFLNIFLGWTFLGWVIAGVWAIVSPKKTMLQ